MADFQKLVTHVEHHVEVVCYGKREVLNVAVECVDCGEVLVDADSVPAEILGERPLTPGYRVGKVTPRWKGNTAV